MKCIQVLLNSSKLCTASLGTNGNTCASIDIWPTPSHDPPASLQVYGIVFRTDERADWVKAALSIGDVITIRLLDDDSIDPPASVAHSGDS